MYGRSLDRAREIDRRVFYVIVCSFEFWNVCLFFFLNNQAKFLKISHNLKKNENQL